MGLIAKLLVVRVTLETPGTPLTVTRVAALVVPLGKMVTM
jgi:hypothetical protein